MRAASLGPALALLSAAFLTSAARANPPIYIAFHWHMHQPVYWPYESVVATADANRWGFNVTTVHTDRTGPYTAWPLDAVGAGMNAGLEHLGASVSFSGSLMENLDALAAANRGFGGWSSRWQQASGWTTSRGNPRVDLVAFGYHHPLMPLLESSDIRLQVQLHREKIRQRMGEPYAHSKGIFPPENAMSERMIPALVAEGLQWVMVDNIHFDRTVTNYPYARGSNLYPPNPADQVNSTSASWVQLNGIWAPSKVSAPWGFQPHWIRYVDPQTGAETKMVAVPTARYEGNEDARGGFGALQYDAVLSQYEAYNTDSQHPMLIVLHHDGDNYGGGTESYYHSNFANFISWVQSQPNRFVATTVQDYLDLFPPAGSDVIHIEDGSWSGADNGDPEFLKWNGNPDATTGYSPDRNSWATMVAARNRVLTAESLQPHTSLQAIQDAAGNETDKAWHYFLNGETSCYWYWDNAESGKWDSHPARAANMAVQHADLVLGGTPAETVAPTIYLPQREPYNPGGYEWGTGPEPSDFKVWTFVYDVSGLASVQLNYRVDEDGTRTAANELYSGGTWVNRSMVARALTSLTDPLPTYQAQEYSASVTGVTNALVDYYVEAVDNRGNRARSPLLHVYVGMSSSTTTGPWAPATPSVDDVITITTDKPGFVHWGVNTWTLPNAAYWPANTTEWSDHKAVETPLLPDGVLYKVQLGPFNNPAQAVTTVNFVFHYSNNAWSTPDLAIPLRAAGADAGVVVPDAGSGTADAAVAPQDAGSAPVDAGNPVADSGNPVADAGNAGDAATQAADASVTDLDAGTVSPDAAVTAPDAAVAGDAAVVGPGDAGASRDASLVRADAGQDEEEAGDSCTCRTSSRGDPAVWMLVALLALRRGQR